jgi:transmembrane sensor
LLWAAALASALGVALLVAHSQTSPPKSASSAWQGTRLETSSDALAVTLVDGSKLKLDPQSRVEMGEETPSAVRLSLKRGRIDCDVTHREGRSFTVLSGGVEVRVVGTRFSVATEQDESSLRVEVRVERGAVEVRGPGSPEEVTLVEAGRSWSRVTKISALPKPSGASEHSAELAEPTIAPGVGPANSAGSASPSPAANSSAVTNGDAAAARGANPSPSSARESDARELLEQASSLWREGRVREAAQAYQNLLTTYPRDPRAGLAAFELGRLRMDRLADLAGAVRALERAVTLAPGSSFREDALARLVTAYAGVHNQAGCARARDQYLREFPAGVRRRTVAAACGSQ